MLALKQGTVLLIGAGKMGGAFLKGWRKAGIDAAQIKVIDPLISPTMRAYCAEQAITCNPREACLTQSALVVIAVKPQILEEALKPLLKEGDRVPLVVSIVAGRKIADFKALFGKDTAVVRAMPTIAAAVGCGITAMVSDHNVTLSQKELVEQLLSCVGDVVLLAQESMLDAVTALSGSGPAYVFYMAECLAAMGMKLGLDPAISRQLARATIIGAGALMRFSTEEPEILRQNVTSPQGTTQAALEHLMAPDTGLMTVMEKAMRAAADRAKSLSIR